MKKVFIGVVSLMLMICGVVAMPTMVWASSTPGSTSATNMVNQTGGSTNTGSSGLTGWIQIIINIILGIVGIIAVVMVIVGGINFTTSQGDPGKTKKARDTILYSIVGLVVALLAFAIVNFVLGAVFNTNTNTP